MTTAAPALPPAIAQQSPVRRYLSMTQDVLLVMVTLGFIAMHLYVLFEEGRVTSIFFAAEMTLLVTMYLIRRRPTATSTRWTDWLVATGGTWLIFAIQPQSGVNGLAAGFGTGIQLVGIILTSIGFISLGKSFGIVAANRGLKTRGLYGLVRHPIYFSHSLTLVGVVLANLAFVNIALAAVIICFLVLRIRAEERVLSETSDYAAYRATVRWRLVPGLY